jgi:PAS domain S-box-containing protein
MVAKAKTVQELLEEIQALRNQLQESEETLNAIRRGEVDALVVNGQEGEQVFTLEGADHPYRLMVETMSEGAVTISADETLVYCNQSFALMVETPHERLIGTSLSSYIANDDIPYFLELLETAKTTHSRGELQLRRVDGTLIPVLVSLSSPHFQDAVCVVVTDLSEHKRNEELLLSQEVAKIEKDLLAREREARSEAEKANRLKDEFLATVSHELRNPLGAILGWSAILRSHKSQEQTDHAVAVIERNARLQLKLIEDLLDVSRIVSGKLTIALSEVDLVKVIRAAAEAAQPDAAAKQIELRVTLGSESGIVVGDGSRLQQVVGNLISNAIKFTPASGKVTLRFEVQNDQALISVTDTGKGISADFLPFVFERFRQQDASSKRVQGGLGLGLAIVRTIVELHRGTVKAESQGEDQGAVFSVTLPLACKAKADESVVLDSPTAAHVTETDKQSEISLAGLRILLIDDDADGREFVKMLLVEHGANVSTVETASEARSAVEGDVPHVMICDIGLPSEDGYDFIRSIRNSSESAAAAIPAVALTAYAGADDQARALAAGYQMHLAKPVEPSQLLNAIVSLSLQR